ncbi:hypothetical protein V8C86DRAFT_2524293 [Haematococcus lacustris]
MTRPAASPADPVSPADPASPADPVSPGQAQGQEPRMPQAPGGGGLPSASAPPAPFSAYQVGDLAVEQPIPPPPPQLAQSAANDSPAPAVPADTPADTSHQLPSSSASSGASKPPSTEEVQALHHALCRSGSTGATAAAAAAAAAATPPMDPSNPTLCHYLGVQAAVAAGLVAEAAAAAAAVPELNSNQQHGSQAHVSRHSHDNGSQPADSQLMTNGGAAPSQAGGPDSHGPQVAIPAATDPQPGARPPARPRNSDQGSEHSSGSSSSSSGTAPGLAPSGSGGIVDAFAASAAMVEGDRGGGGSFTTRGPGGTRAHPRPLPSSARQRVIGVVADERQAAAAATVAAHVGAVGALLARSEAEASNGGVSRHHSHSPGLEERPSAIEGQGSGQLSAAGLTGYGGPHPRRRGTSDASEPDSQLTTRTASKDPLDSHFM